MLENKTEAPYTQRIEKVFERIQNIMATNQDERSDKIKQIVNLIRHHEKMSQEQDDQKLHLFESIFERISLIQKRSVDESKKRQRNIAHLQENFMKVQKKCKSLVSNNSKERQEIERKFRERIDNIFNKQKDLLEEVMGYTNENLHQLSIQEQKLPALGEHLSYQSELRSEIQSKIYEQFLEQISQLKKLFENQRAERVHDHEQTLILLKSTYTKYIDKLKHQQNLRQKNEALVLKVVEQLVNQISTSYN